MRIADTYSSCLLVVFAGAGCLASALITLRDTTGSAVYFLQLGFGSASQYAQGRLNAAGLHLSATAEKYGEILFANMWQFLVSILYIQYNSLLTCMLANREWYRYSAERKSLRVSAPLGLQRSSYFVSMPLRYGVPLITIVAILHWTLSQSVFVLLVEVLDDYDALEWVSSTVGFSVWPIITGK
jgi:hypothetical protein